MSALPSGLTVAQFLEWEERQEAKHEFVDGQVVERNVDAEGFAGGTLDHAAIALNILVPLHAALRGGPCRAFGSDALVETPRGLRYPDASVTCDKRDFGERLRIIRFPKLVVEVISPSSPSIDLEEKYDEYTALPSLEEYLVVDSRKRWARVYRRQGDLWTIPSLPPDAVSLESVGLSVSLSEIYSSTSLAQ